MSWQAWTGWYVGFSCSMAQVAVHIFLQSTVLLGLGLVAGRLLRRRGAATQSVAYRTTLLAILLCPGVCCFFAAAGVEGVALPWPGSFDTGRPLGIGSSLPTARTAAPTAFATTQPRYEAGPDRGSLESSRRPIPVTVGHQPDAALSGSYASAEEVCDDYVVHFGGDRAQYARRLVNVAQRYQPLSAGVNVVSLKSLLGRRVARILDSSRRLSLLTGLRALLAIGMAGIAGTLLVGLLGMSGGSRAAEGEEPAMKQKTEERDSETAKQKTMLVEGCVVDAAGRAIAGAHVAVLAYREKWGDDNFWLLRPPEVAYQGATAADGRFQCRVPQTSSTVHYAATVVAIAPGYGMNWWELEMDEPAHSVQITLEPEQPLHGRLVGLEGAPAGNVQVRVESLYYSEPKPRSVLYHAATPLAVFPPCAITDRTDRRCGRPGDLPHTHSRCSLLARHGRKDVGRQGGVPRPVRPELPTAGYRDGKTRMRCNHAPKYTTLGAVSTGARRPLGPAESSSSAPPCGVRGYLG